VKTYKLLTESIKDEFFGYLIRQVELENLIPVETAMKWVEEYLRFIALFSHA
jgi:hypothetical protein